MAGKTFNVGEGFEYLDPKSVGDSYAHSPNGSDSRGERGNWTTKAKRPDRTDDGAKDVNMDAGTDEQLYDE